MLNRLDLQRDVRSLDMLISAISSEIMREPDYITPCESQGMLLREMEEALYKLRQARGLRKILLAALDNTCDIVIYKKQAMSSMRREENVGRSLIC
jgi:hypothetical protein